MSSSSVFFKLLLNLAELTTVFLSRLGKKTAEVLIFNT
jgi:hypothetical protein